MDSTGDQYWLPTEIIFGEGELDHLAEHVPESAKKILVVSGSKALRSEGVLDRLQAMLGNEKVVFYEGVPSNPVPQDIDNAVIAAVSNKCDVVIGIGGGSVIDVAKCVALLSTQPAPVKEFLRGDQAIKIPGIPCIAVPSTAGTGSEVTKWSTVWDPIEKRKYSLDHDFLYPRVALVDPTLTYSMPGWVTATTGLDALTQAIEAYWSKASQPTSDMYALAAVSKIINNLKQAFDSGDPFARREVAAGSLMAGQAFSNTRTTICHSLSYPMTANWGIVHGQAVSITLPVFLEANAEALAGKIDPLLEALEAPGLGDGVSSIRNLMEETGLKTRLNDLGIDQASLSKVIEEGYYPERADNNPVMYTPQEIHSLLQEII
ncbi:MAG: hypothetical protein CMM75_10120 [Rhodospirillaceae bacterium]|nr:hypothetical protein [Rhodospirillaceae bacterium]